MDGDGWENKYEVDLGTDPGNPAQVPTESMVIDLIVTKVNEYFTAGKRKTWHIRGDSALGECIFL